MVRPGTTQEQFNKLEKYTDLNLSEIKIGANKEEKKENGIQPA